MEGACPRVHAGFWRVNDIVQTPESVVRTEDEEGGRRSPQRFRGPALNKPLADFRSTRQIPSERRGVVRGAAETPSRFPSRRPLHLVPLKQPQFGRTIESEPPIVIPIVRKRPAPQQTTIPSKTRR